MSTCKNCENLREHLRACGKEIKRLRAKLRKPAGKVLAHGCACRAGESLYVCLREYGRLSPGCGHRGGGYRVEVREVKQEAGK